MNSHNEIELFYPFSFGIIDGRGKGKKLLRVDFKMRKEFWPRFSDERDKKYSGWEYSCKKSNENPVVTIL